MKKIVKLFKEFLNDESGQGATEYILLLVVVVAVALLFRRQLTQMVTGRLDAISGALQGFDPNN